MSGAFAEGRVDQVSGSKTKDNNRANLSREIQKRGGANTKAKSKLPEIPNAFNNANSNMKKPSGIPDLPRQKGGFNDRAATFITEIPKQVNEALGGALMASVSVALITGGLAGIPAIVGASDFFAQAAGGVAEIPMDLFNEFGMNEIA